MTFDELVEFMDRHMRMSHVYQPVMLKVLLQNKGVCPEAMIAGALLQQDQSQLEYYERVTRDMVGRVLRKHGVVIRDQPSRTYALSGFDALTPAQVGSLVARCDAKLAAFIEARGDRPWAHRRRSAGYISGSVRYEVLKTARFRCELCGISADDKALEVDHIVPSSREGRDDISNYQALCYSCNAMKRDRDDVDFRDVRSSYALREPGCPFCEPSRERIVCENTLAVAVRDAHPVTEGHTLVLPRRHVASVFALGRSESNACLALLASVRGELGAQDSRITGFNLGVNDGPDAGQTVLHGHWHLIPRRPGDVENPRGGVRNTIPGKGDY